MADRKSDTAFSNRMNWLDNLRTFMVFLVVALHAGLVYESSGIPGFFWIVDDPSTNDWSGLFNLILDIFVMPTIFFVSGFLAPASLDRKSGRAFLESKFKRLMVPWLVAVLTLIPLYKVIFLYSRNLPQENWLTYFHWSNGIWGQNWLWFLPVLFLFDTLYLFGSRFNTDSSRITLTRAISIAFLVSFIYSIGIDFWGAQGWTKTILLDFQNERLLTYFAVFLVGALCFRLKTLESERGSRKLYLAVSCTAWFPVFAYLVLVIHPLISPGNYFVSRIVDGVMLRGTFLTSLLCLVYLSVETFRSRFNRLGRVCRELSRDTYTVYIIHTVVLGGVALTLLNVGIPSLLKHLVLAVATYSASVALIILYRAIKGQIVTRRGWRAREAACIR